MATADTFAHHPGMPTRLLIVDDSQLICNGLARLLQDIQGVEAIQTACTLAETLECLRRQLPTLLVLDPGLRDCNAIELINLMKKMMPDTPIVVLSNDPSEFNRNKCRRAGANWLFDKASELEQLQDVVKRQAASDGQITTTEGNLQ